MPQNSWGGRWTMTSEEQAARASVRKSGGSLIGRSRKKSSTPPFLFEISWHTSLQGSAIADIKMVAANRGSDRAIGPPDKPLT
jgi:hypothetical protein